MKKIIISSVFSLLFATSFAQINFTKASFAELKALAKKEKKIIFIDAYAEWCGPRKMMSKQVFTQKEVGDIYNKNFINAKIDMEKGEGIILAKQFKIYGYPTLLFINAEGKEIHKFVGGLYKEDFIKLGEKVSDPQFVSQPTLTERYNKGDRSLQLLSDYIIEVGPTDNNKAQLLSTEYVEQKIKLNDKTYQPNELSYFYYGINSLESNGFKKLIADEQEISKATSKGNFNDLRFAIVMKIASKEALNEDKSLNIEKFKKICQPYFPKEIQENMITDYQIKRAQSTGDIPQLERLILVKYKDSTKFSPEELQQVAKLLAQQSGNVDVLKQAISWMKNILSKDTTYNYLHTISSLYYKLGDYKNAKIKATEAIAIAKELSQNYDETQQILDQINKK